MCVLGRHKRRKRRPIQREEDSIVGDGIAFGVSGGRGRSRDGLEEVSVGSLRVDAYGGGYGGEQYSKQYRWAESPWWKRILEISRK